MVQSTKAPSWFVAIGLILFALQGIAQPTGPQQKRNKAPQAPPAATAESVEALQHRLQALEEKNRQQEAINAKQAEQIEELTDRLDESEFDALEEVSSEFEPTFQMFGFFDVGLTKFFIKEGDALAAGMPEDWTFVATDFNLYFLSRLTESLQVLAEVKFTFLPLGSVDLVLLERRDTTVQDPHDTSRIRLGSIFIERIQLTWKPADWFGVTAGRFITPFGIWNTDHGNPVLLGTYAPYIMLTELVPLRQTGVMIHGRFFPTETLYLDYAVTVSNGRGPADEVYDLDDDKAVGLKLKMTHERENFTFSLGGYGYFGHSTDKVSSIASIDPIMLDTEQTERFSELTGSLDLLIELFGVKLQAEYARTLVKYETRTVRRFPMTDTPVAGVYQPDYMGWVAYTMISWTLPLERLLGSKTLTPFLMFEVSEPDDTIKEFDLLTLRGGFNFKPNAVLALKIDGGWVGFTKSKYFPHPIWLVGAQVAVAF